jgi:hypothetical protein
VLGWHADAAAAIIVRNMVALRAAHAVTQPEDTQLFIEERKYGNQGTAVEIDCPQGMA